MSFTEKDMKELMEIAEEIGKYVDLAPIFAALLEDKMDKLSVFLPAINRFRAGVVKMQVDTLVELRNGLCEGGFSADMADQLVFKVASPLQLPIKV